MHLAATTPGASGAFLDEATRTARHIAPLRWRQMIASMVRLRSSCGVLPGGRTANTKGANTAPHGRAGPCDATKAHLIAEAAKEVSQPNS